MSATSNPSACPKCGCAEHFVVMEGPTADGEGVGEIEMCEHGCFDPDNGPWRPHCPDPATERTEEP